MPDRDTIIARARACLGTRFRAFGRDPDWGLDCVGLAAHAFGLGAAVERPAARYPLPAYALRSADIAAAERALAEAGLTRATQAQPGDLLLLADTPTQLHLAVRTPDGFVHACARLRRVVESPVAPGAIVSAWAREG